MNSRRFRGAGSGCALGAHPRSWGALAGPSRGLGAHAWPFPRRWLFVSGNGFGMWPFLPEPAALPARLRRSARRRAGEGGRGAPGSNLGSLVSIVTSPASAVARGDTGDLLSCGTLSAPTLLRPRALLRAGCGGPAPPVPPKHHRLACSLLFPTACSSPGPFLPGLGAIPCGGDPSEGCRCRETGLGLAFFPP